MLPEKLTPEDPESVRERYKVIRRDTMDDVPGLIVSASVETGECLLRDNVGVTKEHKLGSYGLRIAVR